MALDTLTPNRAAARRLVDTLHVTSGLALGFARGLNDTPTPNRAAARRRDAPASTASITLMRKSSERYFAIHTGFHLQPASSTTPQTQKESPKPIHSARIVL